MIKLLILLTGIAAACTPLTEGRTSSKSSPPTTKPISTQVARSHCDQIIYETPDERGCYDLYMKLVRGAAEGDTVRMQEALDTGARVDGSTGESFTALITAAMMGRLEAVQFLLDRGANIDYQHGSWQKSAISLAVFEGHVDVVAELIKRGANVCVAQLGGPPTFPIQIAESRGNDQIRRILADAGGEDCE